MTDTSPYLASSDRLANVIAALQATATYKYYQLPIDGKRGWAYRIVGEGYESRISEFREVFKQHPEFFRIDSTDKGALVLRRQHPRRYHVDKDVVLSQAEYESLDLDQTKRVSRTPLDASQLEALMDTAIELHAQAVANAAARRWWITPTISVVSAFGGALIGALLAG